MGRRGACLERAHGGFPCTCTKTSILPRASILLHAMCLFTHTSYIQFTARQLEHHIPLLRTSSSFFQNTAIYS